MTTFPIPELPSGLPLPTPPELGGAGLEEEQALLRAFRWFAETSASLEHSYNLLRAEVARLHGELGKSNAGLEDSLKENRRMRERLDGILEGLPCGVLAARGTGEIILINPEARRFINSLTAVSSEPHATTNGADFTTLDTLPVEMSGFLQAAPCNGPEGERCFPLSNGGELWLAVRQASVVGKAIEDGLTELPDQVFILRDVSAAKRLARERDRLRREQALAEMSAVLAHEIRNPLGSLELFAGLLAGVRLGGECREWVEQVQAGLRTLSATVNNVLHFHSLPAPAFANVELGQLLDWIAGFLGPMTHQARVQLCLRNHLRGVETAADRHRLEQVLMNLALNALRAMPGGGWLEISGRAGKNTAVIEITDTGPGIRQEDEGRIFDPGFSTRPGSPGLGLAVCRQIAAQHGGSLVAANRAGMGACFSFTLPRCGANISRVSDDEVKE